MDCQTLIGNYASLWIYGSVARGDADSESDVDVLVVANEALAREKVLGVTGANANKLALSQYTWQELEGIASYGSLFLHHLRTEGRCLVEGSAVKGRLRGILDALGPYRRARADLEGFKTSLVDIVLSLGQGGSIPFELSILGTTMRHASILGCYISGAPCFGRVLPVKQIAARWNLDESTISCFEHLYRYRLWVVRRSIVPPRAQTEQVNRWCGLVAELLRELGTRIDVYERSLR